LHRKELTVPSVSEKPCPGLVFEGPRCGKAEEASGKKDLAKIWCFAEYNLRNAGFVKGAARKKLALEKIKPRDGAENVSGRIYFREYEPGAGTSIERAGRVAGSAGEQKALPKTGLPLRTRL
jgi:hypothetical protein